MSKTTFYFSHDGNARNDEKIISIRLKFGAEGYGIYFMILERLMESKEYIHVKDYNIIAFDLRVSNSVVKSIIEDYGLFEFTEDGKHFYSVSFQNRMKPLEKMREQRREAGLKSAEKRASVQRPFNDRSTTVQLPLDEKATKESKVKESKNTFTNVKGGSSPPVEEKNKIELNSFTEKEKSSAKKEKTPAGLYWDVTIKTWFDFYEAKFRDRPTFSGMDGKYLKLLLKYLQRDTEAKGNVWTEDHAVLCLKKFCEIAFEIDWYKSHFQLKDLVSNYDSIKQSQQKQFKNAERITDYTIKL